MSDGLDPMGGWNEVEAARFWRHAQETVLSLTWVYLEIYTGWWGIGWGT